MLTFRKKLIIVFVLMFLIYATHKEKKDENDKLSKEIVATVIAEMEKGRDVKNDTFIVTPTPKEVSLDCSTYDTSATFDLFRADRLSQENVKALFIKCNEIGIDPYYMMSVAIIHSNFDMSNKEGLFNLGSHKLKGVPYIVEDVMYMEIVDYLLKAKIVTEEDLALQNRHIQGSLIKGYVTVYGDQSLNKLYNYYYVLSGKRLK